MRYLSLCSGIEAATAAWEPLGWEPVAFSEIEPFPCAVLAHHYPSVPNLGDITKIEGGSYCGKVDLVVGGTPCQDFSFAGKRAGLAGERSGLALHFVRLVEEVQPRWFVWENVPGVFTSNRGRDFGQLISALEECGYGLAWRTLDAQYFGVPQRRRRVFLIGYFGDWRPSATALFESSCLRGNTTQGGGKKADIAGTFTAGAYAGGAGGRPEGAAGNHFVPKIVGQAMICKWAKGVSGPSGDEYHNLVSSAIPISTQMALQGPETSNSSREGLGIGTQGDPQFTLQCTHSHAVMTPQMRVRRLTPKECERLQGFPDDYTNVPYHGKRAADTPRYKALGNSMAVPVMAWIGARIAGVDKQLQRD